jgi:hypothetical protein
MKRKEGFLFLFALLLASSALAQTADSRPAADLPKDALPKDNLPQQVAMARCAYAPKEEGCAALESTSQPHPSANTMLAQFPRRMGPMAGPPMGRGSYSSPWISRPSTSHVLFGAAFGFAIGAGLGAKANAGVRGSLGIGALIGLIGAGMGAGIPSFPGPRYYRRDWPDNDEDARSRPGPGTTRPAEMSSSKINPEGQTAIWQPHPPQSVPSAGDPDPVAAEAPR